MVKTRHLLAVLLGITCIFCTTSMATAPDPKDTARQAVEALLAHDAEAFTELVLPDRRATWQLGSGQGIGPAELNKLAHCRDVPVTYSDPQMPDPSFSSSRPHLVIVAFDQPCLVGFTSFTWEPQDKFVIVLRDLERRWYVEDVSWPVTRIPGGLPHPAGSPAGTPR
jgi:hypothetical protein